VPKVTVIIGGSYGAGNYGMCGRAYSTRASCSCGRTRASRSWAASRPRACWPLNFLPRPTIARVQGAAYGGAVGLVSCCDIAIGTARASFALSEARIGLVPATIAPYVVAAIGQRAARRYFQSAEAFDAQTALRLGLLSEIVDEEALDRRIAELVDTLLANSPAAVGAAKQLVFDVTHRPLTEALIEETSALIADIRVSAEGQEGLSAFLEKRKPRWR
jgi:methylglutaconyl-CoA hydratase